MVRPYIFETPLERRLHFTQDATQSAMSLLEPDSLIAPYTRKMMSFLLLNPNPRHIVMLGLGGGSLAKFCYRNLPKTRITVVEIDADVIAMRDEFLIPRDDSRFRVVHGDGAQYLELMDVRSMYCWSTPLTPTGSRRRSLTRSSAGPRPAASRSAVSW